MKQDTNLEVLLLCNLVSRITKVLFRYGAKTALKGREQKGEVSGKIKGMLEK